MKYKVGWAGKDGYLVKNEETGYHLGPFELAAILNPEPAEVPNVIHENGVYLIQVWTSHLIWSTYLHERDIMYMDNPEIGTIAMLPNEHRVKVIALGTEHSLKGEPPLMSVFVKPWPEIGVDGFIKD